MAAYAIKSLDERKKFEKLWQNGQTPKEIAAAMDKTMTVVYKELRRGQDGTRLPDHRLRYSADLAQLRVQQSLEGRGLRKQPLKG